MAITYAHVHLKVMHIISGRLQKDRENTLITMTIRYHNSYLAKRLTKLAKKKKKKSAHCGYSFDLKVNYGSSAIMRRRRKYQQCYFKQNGFDK